MRRSSTSGRGRAREFSAVQPVNGFHQDVESQSTIHSETDRLNHVCALTELTRREAFAPIVHVSRKMCELIARIERAHNSLKPMLITGETGTGKELLARAIHAISPRHEGEFMPFNCATANHELIESRLFGHEPGAFTGADRKVKGIVREANGGTLLLDEVGELSLDLQPVLLRFLQEGEVHPWGADKPIKTNVRVIAATNRDLNADVRSVRFRADLYERLSVLWAHIPPLRERREDIPILIKHFLGRHQQETGKQGLRLSGEAWEALLGYDWPRNVRELENLLYRLALFSQDHEEIGRKRVWEEMGVCDPPPEPALVVVEGGGVIDISLPHHEAKDKLLRLQIEYALKKTGGNLLQAAAILEMDRGWLRETIKRLGIEVERNGSRRSRK